VFVLTTNEKGAIAELKIATAAAELGVPVLRPLTDHCRYDLALEVGGSLLRVQCKWGALNSPGSVVQVKLQSSRCTSAGYVRASYTEDEIDLLAVYCGELDRCYLLPSALAARRKEIWLRVQAPLNGQRACLNDATQFEFQGAIAQLGERSAGSRKVGGSNPPSSIARRRNLRPPVVVVLGMRPCSIAGGLAVVAACLAAAAPACADELETPAPRATDLAAAGGWQAWAAPTPEGRWRLTIRAPGGAVSQPAIPDFGFPPNASIGSDRLTGGRLLAVYSRCDGRSSRIGCDVHAYDLRAGAEERVSTISTAGGSETAPSLARGVLAFVRRGEGISRRGVYAVSIGRRGAVPRRISPQIARETATNGGRVAYAYRSSRGGGLAVRRASGDGGVLTLAARAGQVPRSIALSRYRATWLLFEEGDAGPRVFTTSRLRSTPLTITEARRRLPPDTDSIALVAERVARYLAADGVRIIVPPLFAT
jgi:hypothetical protein